MNFILAFMVAATVSLQTVKLSTAPGKTMVVTGATVSAESEITNIVTKTYVEGLGIEAGVKSVNSKTGEVTLVAADVGAVPTTRKINGQPLTSDITIASGVTSVNSKIGEVELNASDVGARGLYDYNVFNPDDMIRSGIDYWVYDGSTRLIWDSEINGWHDNSCHYELQYTGYERQFYGTGPYLSGDIFGYDTIVNGNKRLYAVPFDRLAKKSETVPTSRKINGKAMSSDVTLSASDVGAASQAELAPISADVRTAYGYSRGTYLYMNANTNSWFAGTNYVFGADATNRTHFAWEDGMNAGTVPCSMALYELRDGTRQCVWDQRDWTAWYWSFKASQMDARIQEQMAASNAEIRAEIASTNNHAWAKWYAASGRVNPDPTTTYVDTKKVCLSPGMNWETVATVSGCGYWTIVGNGLVIGGSGTNAVLEIKDFEGNEIMTITKGAHRLAWVESEDFTGQLTDASGWVCFDMMTDSQPTGYFSTTLEEDSFVAQTDANCPAQYRWEDLGGGEWRIHYLLKAGIVANACFAKFCYEVQGQTKIKYNVGAEISGGLIYNGKKIAPQVSSDAQVGDTIVWKVVQ